MTKPAKREQIIVMILDRSDCSCEGKREVCRCFTLKDARLIVAALRKNGEEEACLYR